MKGFTYGLKLGEPSQRLVLQKLPVTLCVRYVAFSSQTVAARAPVPPEILTKGTGAVLYARHAFGVLALSCCAVSNPG